MSAGLSPEEHLRYSRHMILPEVGLEGQKKLKAARVLLVGAGGLGSPSALYLAAAGVGRLGIVDFDQVDLTNLHRQVLHGTSAIGRSKLDSAAERLHDTNPNVEVVRHEDRLTSENALGIFTEYDLILDGTDNFPTRYLVNDACVLAGKVNMYGSIFRFDGQATVFCAPGGPCYRCLYPEPPPPGAVPSCADAGVLGVLPGTVGLIQATEAVKWILGVGDPLIGRLLLYDALSMRFTEVRVRRDPDCPVCGENPTVRELIDYVSFCGVAAPRQSAVEIDCSGLRNLMAQGASFTLLDVREPYEREMNFIPDSVFIPLGELAGRVAELDREREIVAYCRMGGRSAEACRTLQSAGFARTLNLTGGIEEWFRTKPSLPRSPR